MTVQVLDTTGMKRPQPVLKVAVRTQNMKSGDVLEVLGDCPTLERDLRIWCDRLNKVFLTIKNEGKKTKRIQIQF